MFILLLSWTLAYFAFHDVVYVFSSNQISSKQSTLTTTHATKRDTAMVRREACRGLANLSASLHIGEMIIAEGAQPPLMELLLGGQGEQCSRMAAMCLANLSSNHASHGRMLAEGLLEPVQALCLNSLDPKKNIDGETVRFSSLFEYEQLSTAFQSRCLRGLFSLA